MAVADPAEYELVGAADAVANTDFVTDEEADAVAVPEVDDVAEADVVTIKQAAELSDHMKPAAHKHCD